VYALAKIQFSFQITKPTQFPQISTRSNARQQIIAQLTLTCKKFCFKVSGDQNQMSHLDMKVLQLIC